MKSTQTGLNLVESLIRAKSALSPRTYAARMKLEQLCLTFGAAREKMERGRRLTRGDERMLTRAIDEWENEGGVIEVL